MGNLSVPRKSKSSSSSKLAPCPRIGHARCYCHPNRKTLRSYPSQNGRIRTSAEEGTMQWPDWVATKGYAEHLLSLSNPDEAPRDANTSGWSDSEASVVPAPITGETVADDRTKSMLSAGYEADDEEEGGQLVTATKEVEMEMEREGDEMIAAIGMRGVEGQKQRQRRKSEKKDKGGFRSLVKRWWK